MSTPSKNLRYRIVNGYTLIEVSIAITLSTLLTGIVVISIASVLRFNKTTNAESVAQMQLQALLRHIKSDIHQANSSLWDEKTASLHLQADQSRQITYHKNSGRWTRTVSSKNEPSTTLHFGLEDAIRCVCNQQNVQQGDLLQLTFTDEVPDQDTQRSKENRTFRLDAHAIVGKDHMLLLE